MRKTLTALLLLTLVVLVCSAQAAPTRSRTYNLQGLQQPPKEGPQKPPSGPGDEKPFAELIKDRVVIPGYFTFYQDTLTGSVYMAVMPSQFDKVFLMTNTVSKGDGSFSSNGAMAENRPVYFKRVNKKLLLMEKNVLFRGDTSSAFTKAIPSAVTDGIYATCKIESKPQDSTGAVLIDASSIFVRDAENMSYFVGQQGQTGLSFDRENSYFEKIKSFPENCEIDVKLHFRTSKPLPGSALQNSYSIIHTFHFSLSSLPTGDYVPRIADDRIAAFLTFYQDYTYDSSESQYVYYINRWNLKKKDPSAAMSEPVNPIVFWVENTVPVEYRAIVAEGIELWNKSFEKIGFKNAIVAKQMSDTASWDPADIRYNTVRWILQPGVSYAAGPSQADPFTGQLYDADVRVCVDFIRYMFQNSAEFVSPVSFDGREIGSATTNQYNWIDSSTNLDAEYARVATGGLVYALANAPEGVNKDSLRQRYIHEYLRQLICHEVGHTLGLRHNFKGSTVYSLEQISDSNFTRVNSICNSIMEYAAPNIAGRGKVQGHFYDPIPGPYDDWSIQYMYSDFGSKTPMEELPKLKEIASRAAEPRLVYGTDEDGSGSRVSMIDPLCNTFDLGNDIIKYCIHKIELTRDLWLNSIKDFEKPGVRYPKLRTVFQTAWRSYLEASTLSTRFVGGIYTTRNHMGDPGATLPMEVVAAKDQRRAVEFLKDYVFAPDVFNLPSELLNKLALERMPDFDGNSYTASPDYPIHQQVLRVQTSAVDRLYSPQIIGRLLNNAVKFKPGEEKYLMIDMFNDMRKAIWGEALSPKSVNTFRRQLQLVHLSKLIEIYLSTPATYPSDARTLASNDLRILSESAGRAADAQGVDEMSRAHFKEVVRQIQAARSAQRTYAEPAQAGR